MEPIRPSSGGAHYARFDRENTQKAVFHRLLRKQFSGGRLFLVQSASRPEQASRDIAQEHRVFEGGV